MPDGISQTDPHGSKQNKHAHTHKHTLLSLSLSHTHTHARTQTMRVALIQILYLKLDTSILLKRLAPYIELGSQTVRIELKKGCTYRRAQHNHHLVQLVHT